MTSMCHRREITHLILAATLGKGEIRIIVAVQRIPVHRGGRIATQTMSIETTLIPVRIIAITHERDVGRFTVAQKQMRSGAGEDATRGTSSA